MRLHWEYPIPLMGWPELFSAARESAGERVWGAAVTLARNGAVRGVSEDDEEIQLQVKARGRALPHEVFLWPDDLEWGCDCELPGDPCLHVCAAAIAVNTTRTDGTNALPTPKKTFRVQLRYAFTTEGQALSVKRLVAWPNGNTEPLATSLADANLIANRGDVQAESLLAMHSGGMLPPDTLRRLLVFLEGDADATLDGEPVTLSNQPVLFRVRVVDEDAPEPEEGPDTRGFKVGLYRPAGIDHLYRGAALVDGTLHPTSHGELTTEQRRVLIRGVDFGPDEVGPLLTDYLPRLRERIPVEIVTERLPKVDALEPRVRLRLEEKPGGLEVSSDVVYGDPPVALVKDGTLKRLGDVLPARDLGKERVARRRFENRLGLRAGFSQLLPPSVAADFLRQRLPLHDGPVVGRVDPHRFRVSEVMLTPEIRIDRTTRPRGRDEQEAAWQLDVAFHAAGMGADPTMVMRAWRTGRSLVPLLDGGYAPLPADWLKQHGALLQELLEARDAEGRVDRNATAALVELLEDTEAQVPPDLHRLRSFLEGDEGLPDVQLPDTWSGELRPYQLVGVQWLDFLRNMDLNGILADDMGLGKTIQALAVMGRAEGQCLVVAPTSVLTNWAREAERFVPGIGVNLYHGPSRKLDDSKVVLTSYALLRIDLDKLREVSWNYVILDEAQFIKNPASQTARAACKVPSDHRLCMTGTPVENRLDELWSLFRFLMPGLLGSLETFRERFVRPIEAGDVRARAALRRRVRPYVLRRLKTQVATELPPLTEVVLRCTLPPDQRKLYDTVRMAVRADVQKALEQSGNKGSTLQILEALLRMRQACCDPALLPGDVGDGVSAAKLDELEDLLVELVCEDHKLLVFSQWTGLLDRVEPRLKKLGIDWVRLDGSTRNRQAVIDRFQDPSGPPVFLLSLKAGGTGLNLTAADYVVLLDPWWNPAVEQQATDRAHRIGQDKPVVSLRLIAEGTVEERVLALQEAKRDLADAALGTEGGFVRSLNASELRSLFED